LKNRRRRKRNERPSEHQNREKELRQKEESMGHLLDAIRTGKKSCEKVTRTKLFRVT